jgi:Na+/melibiose symporter-like transporter
MKDLVKPIVRWVICAILSACNLKTWGRRVSLAKVYQLLISMAVLTVMAIIGERHRDMAGLLAAMPLQIPLAIWIVYSNTGGSVEQTTEFARAAFFGIIPTSIFCLAVWLALGKGIRPPQVYLLAYAIWIVSVFCSYKLIPR